MKKTAGSLVASFVLVAVSLAAPKDKTFTGEIMDSQCSKNGLARDDVEKRRHG